jgi:hypothetical protein
MGCRPVLRSPNVPLKLQPPKIKEENLAGGFQQEIDIVRSFSMVLWMPGLPIPGWIADGIGSSNDILILSNRP